MRPATELMLVEETIYAWRDRLDCYVKHVGDAEFSSGP